MMVNSAQSGEGWGARPPPSLHTSKVVVCAPAEPVFVIVYGAQESIPRNRFRQPMWLGGPVRKIGLSYWPARLGIDSWAPQMVYKYGLRERADTPLLYLSSTLYPLWC
jgi:hypothetical protein